MDALRGTHGEVPVWICLKWLERTPTRGLLGFQTAGVERWFWVLDGHVVFAWSGNPAEHLFDRWRSAGWVPDVAAVGTGPPSSMAPESLLSALPPAVTEASEWESFWTGYYVELLSRVLQALPDVQYLWVPHAWTSHPRMVALPIAVWVEQAIERVPEVAVLRDELTRVGTSLEVRVPTVPAPESLRPSQRQVLDLIQGPVPLAELLQAPLFQDDAYLRALWTLVYRGTLQIQPATRSAPTLQELLDFYSAAFSAVGRYLEREIESLAPLVLQKNVTRMEATYPEVFENLTLGPDYRIDHWEPQLRSLLRQRLITLDDLRHFLEETLMLHLLSVQNILGPAHYTTVVEILQALPTTPAR
ncbi:hypothetical protein HRbin11_00080 [bacterium HR11]|nr:hypothetical protein HRbin11_00080 [bacterium HR11]